MKRAFRLLLPPIAMALAIASCSRGRDEGPVTVSVIGGAPEARDPDKGPLDAPGAVLLAATAQGLVRYDAAGQIEPGAAGQWDVSSDGLYFTFRTAQGLPVDAGRIARTLRAAIAPASRNALKPVLGAIEEIVAVTPEVVEIRMRAPRPNMLQLLAQPELAIPGKAGGTGPFHIRSHAAAAVLLAPSTTDEEEVDAAERRRRQVWLRGERAAIAVARFEAGQSALVLGGRFADLPIARAAKLPANALHFDPVVGLFGLEIADADGFAGDAANRRALSMAIDRDRLVKSFAVSGWSKADALVPGGLADLPAPAQPDFLAIGFAARQAEAREAVAAWTTKHQGGAAHVRVALPRGPGARLLFALLRLDWQAVGITAEAVGPDDPADLRLIDAVAPADIASWYLRHFTCDRSVVCDAQADAALAAARDAPSFPERNDRLAEADAILARVMPFIPIAAPLRWSLVTPRLAGYQDNARGVHPLNHLRPVNR